MKISDNEILVEKEIHRIIDFIYNRKQQFERSYGSKLNINLAKKWHCIYKITHSQHFASQYINTYFINSAH